VSTVDRRDDNDVAEERLATSGMGLRLEPFVEDMGESVNFYRRVLGFEVVREEPGDYASLRSGDVMLGIGPVAKLPETGGYFTRSIASQRRGLGVEIVMEVDDLSAAHRRVLDSAHPVFEPPQQRPWGLWDFRIVDPDGYYLRFTSMAQETVR
jgi:predicted enzyme related to lactoylglutathione lyase